MIGRKNQPFLGWLSRTRARTHALRGSKSLFFLDDGLGESKKQPRSNAKAFRIIDRAADVLQIDQVHWPF